MWSSRSICRAIYSTFYNNASNMGLVMNKTTGIKLNWGKTSMSNVQPSVINFFSWIITFYWIRVTNETNFHLNSQIVPTKVPISPQNEALQRFITTLHRCTGDRVLCLCPSRYQSSVQIGMQTDPTDSIIYGQYRRGAD